MASPSLRVQSRRFGAVMNMELFDGCNVAASIVRRRARAQSGEVVHEVGAHHRRNV